MKKKKEKKESKLFNFFILLFLLIELASSGFLVYEISLLDSIENILRYSVMTVIGIIDLYFIFKTLRYLKGKSKKRKGLFLSLLFIISLICVSLCIVIGFFYSKIDSLNKDTITYTSNMIVLADSPQKSIEDIANMKIGILNDKKSPEGYIIPQEIIRENKLYDENEIVEYEEYNEMIADLYAKDLDAMFVSDNYVSMFSIFNEYENIQNDTRIIISKSKKMKKSATSKVETASSGKSVTEPFTILLMGIDSTDEVLSKNAIANGDTLILITFNPKTLNATMLSIPRDSYVPIACWSGKPENKITHAAAYGNDCMINTIENYFDRKIDYYAKINFKGFVKLIDAVGGVEVDVAQKLCTDDSSRGKEVCISPGYQTLHGEEALVYARNRKQLVNGDFGRGQHQQEIVMALINKMKGITDVTKFMEILNTVSNSIDTNLTTKQILSFYNVGKDIIKRSLSSEDAELINIQQLYLQGTGQMIYDQRARMVLWDYIPNPNSQKDIINAMKENLGLIEHEAITEFKFSINEPYVKKIIGEGPYARGFYYDLLPNFVGDSKEQASSAAAKLGISVSFKGSSGYVVSQSIPEKSRIDLIKNSLVLTLSSSEDTNKVIDKDKDEDKKEDKENKQKEDPKTTDEEPSDTVIINKPEDSKEEPKKVEPEPTEDNNTTTGNGEE